MAQTEARTSITDVGAVGIPVTDQDRALAFYVDTLGFEKRSDMPYGEGMRWLEVAPAGAATTLAIVPPRPGEPTGVETNVILSTSDIDADHERLRAAGVDTDESVIRMEEPVPPMFFLRDPDGNRLLVVERE